MAHELALVIGSGGGGGQEMAQVGGREPQMLQETLEQVEKLLIQVLPICDLV